jgi:hypothetical protein
MALKKPGIPWQCDTWCALRAIYGDFKDNRSTAGNLAGVKVRCFPASLLETQTRTTPSIVTNVGISQVVFVLDRWQCIRLPDKSNPTIQRQHGNRSQHLSIGHLHSSQILGYEGEHIPHAPRRERKSTLLNFPGGIPYPHRPSWVQVR